jgi:hypothetical protein
MGIHLNNCSRVPAARGRDDSGLCICKAKSGIAACQIKQAEGGQKKERELY